MGPIIGIVAALCVTVFGLLLRHRVPSVAVALGTLGFVVFIFAALPYLRVPDWPASAALLALVVLMPAFALQGLAIANALRLPRWQACLSMGVEPLLAISLAWIGASIQRQTFEPVVSRASPFLWLDEAVAPFLLTLLVLLPLSLLWTIRQAGASR